MSEETMKKRQQNAPHTVDSTNSSVADSPPNHSYNSPVTGSAIISNGANTFLTETLRTYIDALKFDTSVPQEEPLVKDNSNAVVAEFLGRNKNPSSLSKRRKGASNNDPNSNARPKSKVTFSSSKPSAAFLDPTLLKSQQQFSSKESVVKRDKSKSSTNTVIREWGKRPLLVESEAPWTPRNRMYQNAIKAVARARQLTTGGVAAINNNNNFSSPYPPPQQLASQPMMRSAPPPPLPPPKPPVAMRYSANSGSLPMFLPTNSSRQVIPFGPRSPVGQQQPVLTGISPMPFQQDFNGRPLAVTIEPPQTNQYGYVQSGGMVFPVQQQPPQQSVVYGQMNSQGVFMPLMEQAQLYQQRSRQQ